MAALFTLSVTLSLLLGDGLNDSPDLVSSQSPIKRTSTATDLFKGKHQGHRSSALTLTASELLKKTSHTIIDSIGNTPLIHLKKLSAHYGVEIYGKAEYLNPGGSVKDRAALNLIKSANLESGQVVTEGTGGNTGVGLSMVASALGFRCYLCMPDNVSVEKQLTMKSYGAEIELCSTKFGKEDDGHYTSRAEKVARERGGVYVNQFLNEENFKAHYEGTGVELLEQFEEIKVELGGFACGAGTGGTIAGVGRRLKEVQEEIGVCLVDFKGSGLKSYLTTGKFKSEDEGSTSAEGVGISRLTKNFEKGRESVDGVVKVTDEEAVATALWLAQNEGVWIGPSAGGNVIGAVKYALYLKARGRESNVCTILCDGGASYMSKMYNKEWRDENGLEGVEAKLPKVGGIFEKKADEKIFKGHVGGG